MPTKTAVVILCWNGRKFLETYLPSLLRFQDSTYRIVVADNGSTDDSIDFLQKNFPSVFILDLKENLGFAKGYNETLRQLDEEFVVILNQDVAVTENWLAPMLQIMENDDGVAAVQPKILWDSHPEMFEYAGAGGGWIDKYGYTFCRGRIFDQLEKDEHQYDDEIPIFWASGACMLVRRKLFLDLGGFEASFFAHMEEIDFCWRLQRNGFSIKYCPQSTVFHLGGGSLPYGNPFKVYLNYRNNLLMMARNLPRRNRWRILIPRLVLDQVSALKSLLTGHFGDFTSVWKAHFYFFGKMNAVFSSYKKTNHEVFYELKGVYKKSLVWDFFIRGKKKFSELKIH